MRYNIHHLFAIVLSAYSTLLYMFKKWSQSKKKLKIDAAFRNAYPYRCIKVGGYTANFNHILGAESIAPDKARFIFWLPFAANLEKHRAAVVTRKWEWRGNTYAAISTYRQKSAFKFAICARRPDAHVDSSAEMERTDAGCERTFPIRIFTV